MNKIRNKIKQINQAMNLILKLYNQNIINVLTF